MTKPTKAKWLVAGVALLALAAGALAALAGGWSGRRVVPVGQPHGWQRVFYDHFRSGLRASRWGRYSGQPAGDPGGFWAPSHVVARHGRLVLETYRDPRFGGRWVSGGVSSARALQQTYGKYEVRFRMDRGKGVAGVLLLWPSGNRWPPEVDFAESGGMTDIRDEMSATLHYGADNQQIQSTLHADFTRWHTMGVEWTPGKIVYTVDGKRWAAVTHPDVPSQPMEMDLQTQTGTCSDRYAPCPDSSTPAHVNLQVAWVAVYAYRRATAR